MARKSVPRITDKEQATHYMENVTHSLKAEMEAVRKIIKGVDKRIGERIKWNAPSYYFNEDMVTFGPVKENKILLVFHHSFIVKIKSKLLEGDYKDRRLVYFADMKSIKANKKELIRIVSELVKGIEKQAM
ncbi:MAG TPA: DUF1801 domain-containing protein [Cyclobacteriaceae bacterium]